MFLGNPSEGFLVADELAEFSQLVEALKSKAAAVKLPLLTEIQAAMPAELDKTNDQLSEENQQLRDAHWKRKSLAAVTLIHLGYGDEVWSLLKFSPDPSLRSFITHYLGKLGTNPNTLAARLDKETEVSIRRALIQSLGGLNTSRISPADRSRIVEQLQALYLQDPDPGIHGSASWALRKWRTALPELPLGEPVLTDEQKTRIAKLAAEVERIRQDIVTYEQKLPAQQAVWEQQLREQPAASPASLSDGLVAHFPLDETEGAKTVNAIVDQQGGTFSGPVEPDWVRGVLSGAIRLHGNGEIVADTSVDLRGNDAISFGCWFICDGQSGVTLISTLDPEHSHRGCLLSIFKNEFEVLIRSGKEGVAGYEGGGIKVKAAAPKGVAQPYWQHLFATYDGCGTATGVELYLNGVRQVPMVEYDHLDGSFATDQPVRIGGRSPGAYRFLGGIDDVRIYNRRLREAEIQQLYANGLRALADVASETRTPEQRAMLAAAYRKQVEPLQRLQRQLAAAETSLRDGQWNSVRRWYVNGQGQTMMVIPNPAADSKGQLATGLAISSHEVTVAEFLRFREKHGFVRELAPTDDCPVPGVSWYDAAEYCNWLSQQEGIPDDQWVYQPNERGQYADGMKIKEQWPELQGYRLPSDVEWASACRSGTSGSYGFGEPISLLKNYGWYGSNSLGFSYSVGSLLPNEAGLFDLHGNLWEWVHNRTSGQLSPVKDNVGRVLRGGSFFNPTAAVRSSTLFGSLPSLRNNNFGFRPARTLPPIPLISLPSTP